MRIYLTTVIVSAINIALADIALKTNVGTKESVIKFLGNEYDSGESSKGFYVLTAAIILLPFLNMIITTTINMALILARSSNNK